MTGAAIERREGDIDRIVGIGTAAAVFSLSLAILRLVITAATGPYPDPFSTPPGFLWWAGFLAAITVAGASYVAAVVLLLKGE